MKNKRTNIEALVIRGEDEFWQATGIPATKLAEMRKDGLPTHSDGKCMLFFPSDIEKFIRENWKVITPEIKPLNRKKI